MQNCESKQKKKATISKTKVKEIKLRNNYIFGKSIENPMNKSDVEIASKKKIYLKWPFAPSLRRERQLDDGFIMINIKCRIKIRFKQSINV